MRLIDGDGLAFTVKAETSKAKACECAPTVKEDSEMLQWMTLGGTLLLATAATLCKEPGITVIPLCIFYDVLRGSRQTTTTKVSLKII